MKSGEENVETLHFSVIQKLAVQQSRQLEIKLKLGSVINSILEFNTIAAICLRRGSEFQSATPYPKFHMLGTTPKNF